MLKLVVNCKPLSVNDAFRGRHFPTKEKTAFELAMRMALPAVRVAGRPFYRVGYDFHLKNFALTDWDNCCKLIQDCLVRRGIITDDRMIVDAHVRKFPASQDRMEITVEGINLSDDKPKQEEPVKKARCPYGCLFNPVDDPYHIEACREANKP